MYTEYIYRHTELYYFFNTVFISVFVSILGPVVFIRLDLSPIYCNFVSALASHHVFFMSVLDSPNSLLWFITSHLS